MKKQLSIIPNLLTTGNLVCGFLAIILAVNDALKLANYNDFVRPFVFSSWLLLLAMIFDLLDGIVARLTKTDSKFGMQLDSLADLTSFGVAPAVILYLAVLRYHGKMGVLIAAIYAVCAALRLARFNLIDKVDHKNFAGLPTPAAAGVLASYVLFSHWGEWYYASSPILFLDKVIGWYAENVTNLNMRVIPAMMILIALLMVSNLRFISLKQYVKKERAPFIVFVAVVLLILILIIKPEPMFFAVTLGYVVFGLVRGVYLELKREGKIVKKQKEKAHGR
ncbi:MAG: CDP-diacylglycerol--serine O-phosphatidyltransferase [Candidatus Firestonebacteria bacterium]|nr:CDP-diacylglycerol--serine O-phosphatidyltransferase [Candidatus Firestonebacteria bacterium]